MDYDIANKLRLITKEPNHEIRVLWNQPAMYEAVKALITETSLIEFSLITIQQKFIILQTCVPYEMLLLEVLCQLLSSLQLVFQHNRHKFQAHR
jgi:hypothetical protein